MRTFKIILQVFTHNVYNKKFLTYLTTDFATIENQIIPARQINYTHV